MTFDVAQSTGATLPNGTVAGAPTWTDTDIEEDQGTMIEIAARPNANETASQDVDVFVFTMAADAASGKRAPGRQRQRWQQRTTRQDHRDALRSPWRHRNGFHQWPWGHTHFSFDNIPVKAGERYAVRVTGTAGKYSLQFDHASVAAAIPNNVRRARQRMDACANTVRPSQKEPEPLPL